MTAREGIQVIAMNVRYEVQQLMHVLYLVHTNGWSRDTGIANKAHEVVVLNQFSYRRGSRTDIVTSVRINHHARELPHASHHSKSGVAAHGKRAAHSKLTRYLYPSHSLH